MGNLTLDNGRQPCKFQPIPPVNVCRSERLLVLSTGTGFRSVENEDKVCVSIPMDSLGRVTLKN